MFKKLLSNLPFNPSLIGQVSFYAKRIKRESAVRRTGFVFLALTMVVQFFAVISPPQNSLSASPDNDMVVGGFADKTQAYLHCRNTGEDYGPVLAHFGISCQDISDTAVPVTLNSRDQGGSLFSMGHIDYPDKAGETEINVPEARDGHMFVRYLWSWDTGASSNYPALQITSHGQTFWLLNGCGNLVSNGLPTPPAPPAGPPPDTAPTGNFDQVDCSNISGWVIDESNVTKSINVDIYIDGAGYPPRILANLPRQDVHDYYASKGTAVGVYYGFSTPTPASIKNGTQHTVNVYAIGIGADGNLNNDNPLIGSKKVTLDCSTPKPPTPNTPCLYNPSIPSTDVKCKPPTPCQYNPSIPATDKNCNPRCTYNPVLTQDNPACKPCEEATTRNDKTACLIYHKTARNVTQNIANANGTVAKAGDVIEYTLTLKNKGKGKIAKKFVDDALQESISSILDYADIVDLHGGQKDKFDVVHWTGKDLASGDTITELITVKIKDPIPQTPISTSDPGRFNVTHGFLTMINIYGDTVTIKLPPSVSKQVEVATRTLPNTGPGTSLMVGFGLTAVVAYFFARSRLFATELEIVREEYVNSGAA